MVQQLREELTLGFNPRYRQAYSAFPAGVVGDDDLRFRFSLFQKSISFGSATFNQLWMRPNSVSGQRNSSGLNGEAIIDYFWAVCLMDGHAAMEPEQQATYLLAKILPLVRSTGGRRVFADARARGIPEVEAAEVAELDSLLAVCREEELSLSEFCRLTAPNFDSDVLSEYLDLSKELFSESLGHLLFEPQEAVQSMRSRWNIVNTRFGRRRGNKEKKHVLDVLSCEAKTAVHRCYSLVWENLLRKWSQQEQLSEESRRFHRLWHLELRTVPSDSSVPPDELFHGHILGLHPAGSLFIKTAVGHDLIRQFVTTAPGTAAYDSAFAKVLNGMSVAILQFQGSREEDSLRARHPRQASENDLDDLEDPGS